MLVYFVGDGKRVLYFEQPIIFLAWIQLNTMFLTALMKNFENFNSISNTLLRVLNFDGLSDYLYLFKKEPA